MEHFAKLSAIPTSGKRQREFLARIASKTEYGSSETIDGRKQPQSQRRSRSRNHQRHQGHDGKQTDARLRNRGNGWLAAWGKVRSTVLLSTICILINSSVISKFEIETICMPPRCPAITTLWKTKTHKFKTLQSLKTSILYGPPEHNGRDVCTSQWMIAPAAHNA